MDSTPYPLVLSRAKWRSLEIERFSQKQSHANFVDSGSSHSFVSSTFLHTCGIAPSAMPPTVVKVANGDTLIYDKQVLGMEWWIQGHTLETDMKVLELVAFDAILSMTGSNVTVL
jgi:endonuclease YncB( thermonuclease family)